MAHLNKLTLIGTLTEEPRLAPESFGKNAATLNLLCKEHWVDGEGKQRESKDYFTVRLYGGAASYAAMNLGKDSVVLIVGKIKNERWVDEETKATRYKTVVVVDRQEGLQSLSDEPVEMDHTMDEPEHREMAASSAPKVESSTTDAHKVGLDPASEEFEKQYGLQKIPF